MDSILGKIHVQYGSYWVISDNDFASTGIFVNKDKTTLFAIKQKENKPPDWM